jgi:hypothetical protein
MVTSLSAVFVAAPQSGAGQFSNNYVPSNLEVLSSQFLRYTPGFIDEAALDLRMQPVAALDQGEGVVRIQLGFLEKDVDSVTIQFLNGQSSSESSETKRGLIADGINPLGIVLRSISREIAIRSAAPQTTSGRAP